jgi:hypothetical protein
MNCLLKGVTMKLRIILSSMVILIALSLSAFGSPAAPQTVTLQETLVPPDLTVVAPTVVAEGTPGVIPVTGEDAPTGLWTLVLFGLLGLLGIAFLVALFSPRHTHEHIDRNPPPPEV